MPTHVHTHTHTHTHTSTARKSPSVSTDGEWKLSDKERKDYQKAFSSILVSYASIIVGEEIGQGVNSTYDMHVSILYILYFLEIYLWVLSIPGLQTHMKF